MDILLTTALVGTGQQGNTELTTGTPVDALLGQLEESNAERRLLLAGGAWSVYRQAGMMPLRLAQEDAAAQAMLSVQPAPPETLAACAPSIVSALEEVLLGQFDGIVIEAAARLREAGQRLPHALLPQALLLGTQKVHLQAVLTPVLGERGRWLGQFKPEWAWVNTFLPGNEDTLPQDAGTIWQEGTLAGRHALLRRLRRIDPEQARQWLADVWKQEKVDARCALLATFEVGLSPEDEAFLEKALDDRSERVRIIAGPLLARLPESAFARRMRERAEGMLAYQDGKLMITPLHSLDPQWQRDGLPGKPLEIGTRLLYMVLVLSLVPPSHWEQRFGASAAELIKAAEMASQGPDGSWGEEVIEGWSYAAMHFADARWATALWQWWCAHPTHTGVRGSGSLAIMKSLSSFLSEEEMEQYTRKLTFGTVEWVEALATLPAPWSREFSELYIDAVRSHITALSFNTLQYSPYNRSDTWLQSLTIASMALPTSLTDLLEDYAPQNQVAWETSLWRQELQSFTTITRLRKRLLEEIHV